MASRLQVNFCESNRPFLSLYIERIREIPRKENIFRNMLQKESIPRSEKEKGFPSNQLLTVLYGSGATLSFIFLLKPGLSAGQSLGFLFLSFVQGFVALMLNTPDQTDEDALDQDDENI